MTAAEIIRGAIAELEANGWRRGAGSVFGRCACCVAHALLRAAPDALTPAGELDRAIDRVVQQIPEDLRARENVNASGRIMLWNDFHCRDQADAVDLLHRAMRAA